MSLSSKMLVVALAWSWVAQAQSGAQVCAGLLMGTDRVRCMQIVSGHTVDPGAGRVCGGILMSADRIECLRGALDKRYQPDELKACEGILMGGERAGCMAAAGTVPPPPRDDRRTRSRRDDDDDEDDERPRKRKRRSRDEDDDDEPRSRRERRGGPEQRVLRLTNYGAGPIDRLYWRPIDGRRFTAIALPAVVGTNQYQDLTFTAETAEVCVETANGYRLHFARVRSSQNLVIAAREPNWAGGRCRDLE